MSRLVKKLVNWLHGGDVRNDSVTPLENGGASVRQQNRDLARNTNTSKSTSRKRKSKLTHTVTLEQMKKDGVFKFCRAGCLSAADIWGDMMIPDKKLNHTVARHDAQIDTDANLARCTTSKKDPRLSHIWRRNSDIEMKMDDWDDIPCLSIGEIMGDMVIPVNVLEDMVSKHDTDAPFVPCFTNAQKESFWNIWRRNSPLTDCGMSKIRQPEKAFDDWHYTDCLSIQEIMKDIVMPVKKLDHTVSNHDAQVDTDVNLTPCNTIEKDEILSSISRRNSQLSNSGTPPKKRKLNDMDDLPRASSKRRQKSATASEQLDTSTEQANHTISAAKAQVDTNAGPIVRRAAEQSQMSPRIPKRTKRRATRRRGKKRNNRPRKQ